MGEYNPNYNWQKVRIVGQIDAMKNDNGKFIWAIGGYSDLKHAVKRADVDKFVDKVVELLKIDGDGVDFDWEHMGDDPELKDE